MLTFDNYSEARIKTAVYPRGVVYPALGLCGEAGEVAEKIKKTLRDHGGVMSMDTRKLLLKELGDVLWYLDALASELHSSLDEVATINLEKLQDRQSRGTLAGSGDQR